MQIEQNAVVTFHYSLITEQQEVLDGTRGAEPIAYLHGHRNIVSGLETALEGREVGAKFQVTLAPTEAYGEHDEEKVFDVERALFGDMALNAGLFCHLTNEQGEDELVTVLEFDEQTVTVDANHPYAGQTLTFDVEVINVRAATSAELEAGNPL